MKVLSLNVKAGPTACDIALSMVENEIEVLSISQETKVLKVIHGYGSHGVGGVIKRELPLLLKRLKQQGKIVDFIQNEKFTTNNDEYKKYFKLYPELILDNDLQNFNPGITIIFLK